MQVTPNFCRLFVFTFAAMAVCLAGCDNEDSIRVYPANKDPKPAPQVKPIDWTLPLGWTRLLNITADQFGGFAKIQVAQNDPTLVVDVRVLQGAGAGDLLPNVNRWERQLSLPASTPETVAAKAKTIQVESHEAHRVDLTGVDDKQSAVRMLAVIVPEGNRAWSFSLKGPPDKVAAHVEAFDAFVGSVHFPMHNHGDEVVSTQPSPADAKSSTITHFTLPAGWEKDPTERQMRFATFFVGQGNDRADVIVTKLQTGRFGDMLENVNRWRREIGLPAATDIGAQPVTEIQVGGKPAPIFDFEPPAASPDARRSSVAMVESGADVWFLKLIGPAKTVADQRANFVEFLKTLQFGEAVE
jgi:hypothetical protein